MENAAWRMECSCPPCWRGCWALLPVDILLLVFRHVESTATLKSAHGVCQQWRSAVKAGVTTVSARKFSPSSPRVLNAAFPKLATLNLDSVHLDANVATLAYLTSLEQLRLRRVILAPLTCSDVVAQPLRGLTRLCLLELNFLEDLDPGVFSAEWSSTYEALTRLTSLKLHQRMKWYIEPPYPPQPALAAFPWGLTGLRTLSLSMTHQMINVPEFTRLSQLQQLTEVQIGGFDVDCTALRAAACCSALQRLAVVDAPNLADPGLTSLSALSALTCLNLASSKPAPAYSGMTDAGILALVGLTRLRALSLAGRPMLSESGLGFTTDLVLLTHLNLDGMPLDLCGIQELAALTDLQLLSLAQSRLLTSQIHPLSQLTSLTHLDISRSKVHDEAVQSLLQLQKLATLSISFSGIGAQAATSLLVGLPHVGRLLLDGIPISMLGIRSLFRSRPGLLMWSPRYDQRSRWCNMFWVHVLAQPQPARHSLRVWYAREPSLLVHIPLWLSCTLVASFAITLGSVAFFVLIAFPVMFLLCALLLVSVLKLLVTRLFMLARRICRPLISLCSRLLQRCQQAWLHAAEPPVPPALAAV
ncbi:hypothetical protein WJX74_002472 [Apatococcus lobatus]|uniref:F-box domain-containing protein n=1 Tax=Apatococcus lobatus TaxID=904363 RepID=A0AAW1R230_9CHLO